MKNVEDIEKDLVQIFNREFEDWNLRLRKADLMLKKSDQICRGGTPGKKDYFSEIGILVYKTTDKPGCDNPEFAFSVFLYFQGRPLSEEDIKAEFSLWLETMADDMNLKL